MKVGDSYTVVFMRGSRRTVYADSESGAWKECVQLHPETTSWDVLTIKLTHVLEKEDENRNRL